MFHRALFCLAAALALSVTCFAQSLDHTRIDPIFAEFAHRDTPGCAVGVDVPGQQRFKAAYGMADLEHNVPVTLDTAFEAGSVSKQFTAAALLLLVERGKVSLND